MNPAERLFIEADVLQIRLRDALINSYQDSGDSERTRKVNKALLSAQRRVARRRRVVILGTVTRDPYLALLKKGAA